MIKFAAVLVLVIAQTALAEAAGPPMFNIKATCRQAQPFTGLVYRSCVSQETRARKKLAKTWSTFKSGARRSCAQDPGFGGAPSYVDMLICLRLANAGAPPR
jgi:hypothetical protein